MHSQYQDGQVLFQDIKHILLTNLIFSNTLPYYGKVIRLYFNHVSSLIDPLHQVHHVPFKGEEEHYQTNLYLNMPMHFHLIHKGPLVFHLEKNIK